MVVVKKAGGSDPLNLVDLAGAHLKSYLYQCCDLAVFAYSK